MSRYLFLFTIGPVQSFISQARKTQDLYSGSFLLSYLIDMAMKKIEKDHDAKFIFPNKDIKSKPNRFVAEVEVDSIGKLGKDLEKYVIEVFEKISIETLDSENIQYDDSFKEDFLKQIRAHLQISWVSLKFERDSEYEKTYKELESLLGSVKNVRKFVQLEEKGRKCSICGERNVLFYRKTELGNKPKYLQNNAINIGTKNEALNHGEGLCAVCFVKRFFKLDKTKFPSNSSIALMDWINKIDKNKEQQYKSLFSNFDQELFFKDNLSEKYLSKNNIKLLGNLNDAKALLKSIYKEVSMSPSKYYAILMMDGDHMGKWLSGEYLEDTSKINDFHKNMSLILGEYSKFVDNNIINPPNGKLVYAGGDDVLAFLNLRYLFKTLIQLRKHYPDFKDKYKGINDGIHSTASAGIVITHYKQPLSEVLNWTRKMEKEAKENGGRDAFSIAVLKHSGEIRKTTFKWFKDSEFILDKFKAVEKFLQNDFSRNFIVNLGREFEKFDDDINDELVKIEIYRLVKRSCEIEDKDKKKKAIKELSKIVEEIYSASMSINNFIEALSIIDFVRRGGII